MPAGTPDEWLFEDWQLIAHALTAATHEDCRCYECDTIDPCSETLLTTRISANANWLKQCAEHEPIAGTYESPLIQHLSAYSYPAIG